MAPRSDFLRCLLAMLIWFCLSTVAGLVAAYVGPGAAAIVGGLLLSVCGMCLHLCLWAIGRTPHWSYAGIMFGSATTGVFLLVNGNSSWQWEVVLLLLASFSLVSYFIYPIANRVLKGAPRR